MRLSLLALGLLALTGCAFKSRSIPDAPIPFARIVASMPPPGVGPSRAGNLQLVAPQHFS